MVDALMDAFYIVVAVALDGTAKGVFHTMYILFNMM
jgi:hypothetical protein